jgi:hypothetical protein
MTNGQSSVGSDGGELSSPLAPELHRERVSVRRRRARSGGSAGSAGSAGLDRRQSPSWVTARSRRRMARSFALCAGVLLLMAIGLYFGLAHQDNTAPVEGAAPAGAVGVV